MGTEKQYVVRQKIKMTPCEFCGKAREEWRFVTGLTSNYKKIKNAQRVAKRLKESNPDIEFGVFRYFGPRKYDSAITGG